MMFAVTWRTVLVLALMAAPAWAQQTPDSDVSGTGDEAPVPEAADAGAAQTAEVPDTEPPEETGTVTPPDQYRASEQISDDLSVSFPVDI
jgi:hypothetical protein